MASGVQLFNRNWSVLIGPPGEPGLLIEKLRVVFSIEKSLEPVPNQATIEISNLGERTRSQLEERRQHIVLGVGYGLQQKPADKIPLTTIFTGDIAKITTKRQGTEITTAIEAADGGRAFWDARLDRSYAPGTRASQVLDGIMSTFSGKGVGLGARLGFNDTDQFQNGLALSGSSRAHLDMLMSRQGIGWSIQDGQVQILPPDEGTTQEVVVLNKGSGLIGTPFKTKVMNQSLLKTKDADKIDSGVACVSLLNPDIRPGRRIKLESSTVNGLFVVTKIKHSGDTHGNNWFTEIEAKAR